MNKEGDACLDGACVSVGETGDQRKIITCCDKCSKEDFVGDDVTEGVSVNSAPP